MLGQAGPNSITQVMISQSYCSNLRNQFLGNQLTDDSELSTLLLNKLFSKLMEIFSKIIFVVCTYIPKSSKSMLHKAFKTNLL